MDPISITAGAVALAAHVLRAAASIKDTVGHFNDAPAVARDMEDEIKVVLAALLQIEAALQRDVEAVGRFRLAGVFDLAVGGCRDTLQHISQEFQTLFDRDDWRARFAIWWNASEIRRLLGRLETRKGSLMLLVQALSLHSVQEMQDLLHRNRGILDIDRLGLHDMVPSYPAYTSRELDSVASEIGSEDSLLGDRESTVSNTQFSFDDILFSSKAYRQSVARSSAKKSTQQKKKLAACPPVSPTLPSIMEAVTEVDKSETFTRSGVTSEEHEAVVLKLREAEARIRTLQKQLGRPVPHPANRQPASPGQPSTGLDEEEMGPLMARVANIGFIDQVQPLADANDGPKAVSQSDHPRPKHRGKGKTVWTADPGSILTRRDVDLLVEYFEGGRRDENGDAPKPSERFKLPLAKSITDTENLRSRNRAENGFAGDGRGRTKIRSPSIIPTSLSQEPTSTEEHADNPQSSLQGIPAQPWPFFSQLEQRAGGPLLPTQASEEGPTTRHRGEVSEGKETKRKRRKHRSSRDSKHPSKVAAEHRHRGQASAWVDVKDKRHKRGLERDGGHTVESVVGEFVVTDLPA